MTPSARSAQARRELDRKFRHLTDSVLLARPRTGWIRAIRQALGMSQSVLGDRLGTSPGAVSQLEHAELDGRVTIAKLREAASALNCTLVYSFVPNTPLEEIVKRQALRIATEQLAYVSETMSLEDQSISPDRQPDLLESHANELITKGAIWQRPKGRRPNP